MNAVLTCLVSEKIDAGAEAQNLTRGLLTLTACAEGTLLRERLRGLELALRTLNLQAGSRVALSPLSDRSSFYAMRALSLEPVYIDSRPDVPAMDMDILARAHAENPVQAVIVEPHLGFLPDMEMLEKQNIPCIQDISRIISPLRDREEKFQKYRGDICFINLESDDLITAGGGIFVAISHGKNRKTKERTAKFRQILSLWSEDIYLSDMNAALGLTQLKQLEKLLAARADILELFRYIKIPHRFLLPEDSVALLTILLKSPMQDVIAYGTKNGIEMRPAFARSIIHNMLTSDDVHSDGETPPAEQYPESTNFALGTVRVPFYPNMRKQDMETVRRVMRTLP